VKGDWDAWNKRALCARPIVGLILDHTVVRVRLDRRAPSISTLVALGVRADGQKVLLSTRTMGGGARPPGEGCSTTWLRAAREPRNCSSRSRRDSGDQQGREQLAETPRRNEGQTNRNRGVSGSVVRTGERFDVSTESNRDLTCPAGKTKPPLPSTIQANSAPLANMNFAPLSASSRVPYGGLLSASPGVAEGIMTV
jgi:hypothetical protein